MKRPPHFHANRRFLLDTELSGEDRAKLKEYKARQASFLGDPSSGSWSEGEYLNERKCARSRLKFRLGRQRDTSRPSGLRFSRYECLARPSFSGTARRERELLKDHGIVLEDSAVKRMFGKQYLQARKIGLPHHPIGHQNFNDRALAQGVQTAGTFELIGRENIAWCTYLADASVHQGPGTFQNDPLVIMEQFITAVGSSFPPEYTILVDGFAEIAFKELKWTQKSHARRFICDVTRRKNRSARIRFASTTAEEFVRAEFPQYVWPSESVDPGPPDLPLFEVPHFHFLIAVFDERGEPIPFADVRKGVKKSLHTASYSLEIRQFYAPSASTNDHLVHGQRDIVNAKRCIEYAIKPSGIIVSDEDLLLRTGFRGLLPDHGVFSLVFSGSDPGNASHLPQTIPLGSRLCDVIAERKRLTGVVKLLCPNNGLPETIPSLVHRLQNMPTPFRLNKGSLALRSSLVSNFPNSLDQGGTIVSNYPNSPDQGGTIVSNYPNSPDQGGTIVSNYPNSLDQGGTIVSNYPNSLDQGGAIVSNCPMYPNDGDAQSAHFQNYEDVGTKLSSGKQNYGLSQKTIASQSCKSAPDTDGFTIYSDEIPIWPKIKVLPDHRYSIKGIRYFRAGRPEILMGETLGPNDFTIRPFSTKKNKKSSGHENQKAGMSASNGGSLKNKAPLGPLNCSMCHYTRKGQVPTFLQTAWRILGSWWRGP